MFRFILWALLFYFGWRLLSAFMRMKSRTTHEDEGSASFHQVEEAQFEDITDAPEKEPPKKPE